MLSPIPENCCFMADSSAEDLIFTILAAEIGANVDFVGGKRGSIDSEGR